MDSNEFSIKKENAKSWFIFAQILLIASGFFFASQSIAITNGQSAIIGSVNIASQSLSTYTQAQSINLHNSQDVSLMLNLMLKMATYIGDLSNADFSLGQSYQTLALSFLSASIIFFAFGKWRILLLEKKLKTPYS